MSLDKLVREVVERDACSGCGLCTRLDTGLAMVMTDDGFLRPTRVRDAETVENARSLFTQCCPGVRVTPGDADAPIKHPTMGNAYAVWEAWATEDEIRTKGSSGGVLTALNVWLLESGRASHMAGVVADDTDARRTVPLTLMSRADALRAAGSRYAPVAALDNAALDEALPAAIGKPCEVAALRRYSQLQRPDTQPLLLSFFCAGTPSSNATDELLEQLDVSASTHVDELWYRGNGWPGEFTARTQGREVRMDYESSWGRTLGPSTQWRCKICVDGIGESSDIVAADFWKTDERGYPDFTPGPGSSALIARTERGLEVIREAIEAGVISAQEVEIDALARVQPLQVNRRKFLLARMVGSALAGRLPPRYPGFRLVRSVLTRPRQSLRVGRSTYRRVRKARA